MKKIKKSFADRARELQRKYKNASYDPMQAQELEDEMTKLMAEQEQIREMLGLNEQPQQVQQFDKGGFTPYGLNNIFPKKLPQDAYLTPEQLSYMGAPMDAVSGADMPLKKAQSTKPTFKGGNKPTNIAPLIKPELVDDNIQRERLNFQYHGNMGNGITPLSATTGMNK